LRTPGNTDPNKDVDRYLDGAPKQYANSLGPVIRSFSAPDLVFIKKLSLDSSQTGSQKHGNKSISPSYSSGSSVSDSDDISEPDEPSLRFEDVFPNLIFACLKIDVCPVTIDHLERISKDLTTELRSESKFTADSLAENIKKKHKGLTMVTDDHCGTNVTEAKHILMNYEEKSLLENNSFLGLNCFNAAIKAKIFGDKTYESAALKLLFFIRASSQIQNFHEPSELQTKTKSIMRQLAKQWPH